jgi:capsular exopolysaccharide synthesis family protein
MRLLRRHGFWLVLAALAGIAGAWLISAKLPVRYSSTAQVDIESHVITGIPVVVPNLATEKLIATSGIVLKGAARVVGTTPELLSKDLSAVESGTSNILLITCSEPKAAVARACANADADAYVSFRNLTYSFKAVRAADPLHATLVTPALLPLSPSGTGKAILLPVGALLGLLIGFGAIFLRDAADNRVRDRADLERCLAAPVIAVVPRVRGFRTDPMRIFDTSPQSKAAESYRYLRARLDAMIKTKGGGGCVLLVASPQSRDGRTSVAANLAFAMAAGGSRVILVDADSRRPVLSRVFSGDGQPGLTDLLSGQAPADQVAAATTVTGLRLVSFGDLAGQPAELFSDSRLGRAFGELRAIADVIIVDSAPLLAVSDGIAVSRASDLVLIVANVRRTRRAAISAAVAEIGKSEPGTVAGILNAVPGSFSIGPVRPGTALAPASPAAPPGLAVLAAQNGRHDPQPDHGQDSDEWTSHV